MRLRLPHFVPSPQDVPEVASGGSLFASYRRGVSARPYDVAAPLLGPPPVITTASLDSGVEGVAYSQTIAVTGGAAPLSFSAVSLPDGLTIDSATGEISGTPTTAESPMATITVSDAGGRSDELTTQIVIESGSTTYIDEVPTTNANVTTTGGWTFGANGIVRATGDGTSWYAAWGVKSADNQNPAEWGSLDVTVEIHSINGGGVWPSLYVLADYTSYHANLDEAFYVKFYSGSNLIRLYSRTGGVSTLLANTTMGSFQAGDTFNLYVVNNGDDTYDLVASINGSPVLTKAGASHPTAFGSYTFLESFNYAGNAATYKNFLAVAE